MQFQFGDDARAALYVFALAGVDFAVLVAPVDDPIKLSLGILLNAGVVAFFRVWKKGEGVKRGNNNNS